MPTSDKIVRLAVVGGQRGAAFGKALQHLQEEVRLTAICDISETVLAKWKQDYPQIETFTDYGEMLRKGSVDAVFIATPMLLHAHQAVMALNLGKHVISEVIAATTLEECWELVETVERTGLTYMLAENYCYMRPNRLVLNMAQQGIFGDLTYAEGGYIHDCRYLIYDDQQKLTWRGEMRRLYNGNYYPTHSLGPVAQWLGVNREGGDRLVSTATFISAARALPPYVRENLGEDLPGAQDDYWLAGDSATTIVRTEKGVVIVLRKDSNSPRPHNMTHYALQGTKAAYLSGRHEKEDPLVWIDGRSPGKSPGDAEWEPLWNYAGEYEHPDWRDWGEAAREMGHGGGDFFVLRDFIRSVRAGTPPPIDVYDAVTWSAIMPLSLQSVAHHGQPVNVPDFKNRK